MGSFREHLDKYSLFCGRNILVRKWGGVVCVSILSLDILVIWATEPMVDISVSCTSVYMCRVRQPHHSSCTQSLVLSFISLGRSNVYNHLDPATSQ